MKRAAGFVLLCVVAVGLLAPLLATEVPWLARVDGAWSAPALRAWWGDVPAAPDGSRDWRDWWSRLDADDWVLLAPVPIDPERVDVAQIDSGPSSVHLCGTDDVGRDLLARLVHGASTAVWVALGAVAVAACLGVPLGAAAGFWGGWIDWFVLRWIELFACFPALVLVMCVAAFVSGSHLTVSCVLGVVYQVSFARIVRGEFLSLRGRSFVETARSLGLGTLRIVLWHMIPAVRGAIFVVAAFVAASAIVVESGLRFLGLGGGGDVVSWGGLLARFRAADAGAWHLWVFPAAAIVVTVLALHAVADRSTLTEEG